MTRAIRCTALLILILDARLAGADPTAVSRQLAELRAGSLPDSVEVVVAQMLPPARAAADSTLVQTLVLERGMTRVAYGRALEGETDLREALALAEARRDHVTTHKALRYLAEGCQQLGRRDEAAAYFADLERRARAAGDDFHAGKALYGLGRLRYRARDLAGADSLYTAARPLLTAAADSADLAALFNGLGNCRAGRGRYRDAAGFYAQAAVMARGGASRSLEAMAMNNLAGVEMILGDPGAAVAGYRRARDIQRELGLWQQVSAPWRNLAAALGELGRYDDARAELTAALAFCRGRSFRDEEAFTLARLAEVELAADQPESALVHCRRVQDFGNDIALDVRCHARLRAAEALQALGRGPAALAQLDTVASLLAGGDDFILAMTLAADRTRVLRELGRPQDAIAAAQPALARAAAADGARYRLPLLVSAARVWLDLAQPDSARACVTAAERLWQQERALPTDPDWRERRGAQAQQLFALTTGFALASPRADVAAAFAAVQRYKARTLLERILGPGEALPAAAEVPLPVTLAQLRTTVLRPGEVFLDVLAGTDRGLLFAVTRDTCLVRPLPGERAWDDLLSPLLTSLETPFESVDPAAVQAVREAFLGPAGQGAAALVGEATTVFICPDGVLHQAPMSLLLAGAGPDDLRQLPSATVLAHLRAQPAPPARAARVLAIAGRENAGHRRLAGAAREVRDLRKQYRHVTTPGGAVADTLAFGGLDPAGFDILHLACHGEVDGQRPWNCALVFGDVRVRAGDVATRDLSSRLAVLSSCGSAAGSILAGEGALGLAAGFLSAGVPAVVATLWTVDDAATSRFIANFYDELAAGQPPAQALAGARAALRADPAFVHPYYWAGFVLVGEGGEPLRLQARPSPLLWLTAVPVLGGGFVIWRRRRLR